MMIDKLSKILEKIIGSLSIGGAAVDTVAPTLKSEPKVYSLHFGINNYDSAKYGQEVTQLQSCHLDALAFQRLLGDIGNAYIDQEATADRFTRSIGELASKAVSGDTVVITQSSHGTRFEDEGGDEVDGYDEGTLSYDRIMWDDEIKNILSFFKPGVNLITIWDTCHSGTGTRVPNVGETMLSKEANLSTDIVKAFWEKKQGYDRDIKCNYLHLAAAQDNEFALDGPRNGNFTGTFLVAIERRKRQGLDLSISAIMEEVTGVIVGQHPNIDIVTKGGKDLLYMQFPIPDDYV